MSVQVQLQNATQTNRNSSRVFIFSPRGNIKMLQWFKKKRLQNNLSLIWSLGAVCVFFFLNDSNANCSFSLTATEFRWVWNNMNVWHRWKSRWKWSRCSLSSFCNWFEQHPKRMLIIECWARNQCDEIVCSSFLLLTALTCILFDNFVPSCVLCFALLSFLF